MLTIWSRRSRAGVGLWLALAASLWASRAVAQPRMPTHVACVGDSITAGYMASSASAAYPSVLQTLFGSGVQVMNYGHTSATMLSVGDLPYQNQPEYTAATSFVSGAGATAVVDVIIMLGTNDSKSYNWMVGTGTRAQQFVTDCGAMVDHFALLPTHPVVYLAYPPRAFTNTYGISGTIIHDQILPLIQQVAAAKGVPIIDVDTPTASLSNLFPDGVHPNDTGYALVAQVMHDGLLRVPQVTLTQPTAGASVAGPAVALAATASGGTVAITGVEFFAAAAGGQPTSIGRGTAAPFMATWAGAAAGSYQLTAKATDSTSAAATSSPITVTVTAGGTSGTGGQSGSGGRGGASGQGGSAGAAGAAGASGSGGQPGGVGGGGGTPASGGRGGGGQGGGQGGALGAGGMSASGGRGGAGQGGSPGGSGGEAGTSGSGGGGRGGASTGGTGGGSGGATDIDAGLSSSGGSGCSCGLAVGGHQSGGLGLRLGALGFALALLARRRRTP